MGIKTYSLRVNNKPFEISASIKTAGDEWIICVHGIQSNKNLFTDLFKQTFLSQYSLLAIDLVGFGNSSKPHDFSYSIADQAIILDQIIKIENIKKLNLLGHSLGGTVSTILLDKLNKIIKSFINLEGNLTLADSSTTKEVASYTFNDFSKSKYDQIKNAVKESGEISASFRLSCLKNIPDYVFYNTSLSIIEWVTNNDLLTLFTNATCKRLYIYGDKNAFKKSIVPDTIQKISIDNAGHFMLLDNPVATYDAIKHFLIH